MPIFIVRKPLGVTSHDVVAQARRALRTRAVGHAGTLDPLATGVLVLLSEQDTKLSQFLTASTKRYYAWVAFGADSLTYDAEGPIVGGDAVAARELDEAAITAEFPHFLTLTEQRPPAFSAVQQDGKRSYERARQGEEFELPPRSAGYEHIELLGFAPSIGDLPLPPRVSEADIPEQLGEFPVALIDVTVQAGTYVRSFARDLGARLGTGAHLAGLVRYQAGAAHLEKSAELNELHDAPGASAYDVLPTARLIISRETAERVRLGQRPKLVVDEITALFTESRELVALVEPHPDNPRRVKFIRVFTG